MDLLICINIDLFKSHVCKAVMKRNQKLVSGKVNVIQVKGLSAASDLFKRPINIQE